MRALNFVRGTVRVKLKCRYPERAVNICASRHVEFWDLSRDETGATMTVRIDGYRKLRAAASESGAFSVSPIRKNGVPFLLWRVRKRYVLLAGMVLCLLLVWVSSLFVWQIDVDGNETVPTAEILAVLKSLGVGVGSMTFSISQERISNEMLLRFPELCWITLNTYGSRIQVIVREATPKPEIRDTDVPTKVVAARTGIITDMFVVNGEPVVEVGSAVEAGEELVSGVMPDGRLVHGEAEIWARTLYEKSLSMPLETVNKNYTGRETTKTAIILGGNRINLYFTGGNPYANCDKIEENKVWRLGSAVLPVTVIRETYREYEPVEATIPLEDAVGILEVRLTAMMEDEIGDGYPLITDFAVLSDDSVVTVTLYAECVENISRQQVLTDEEIARAESAAESGPEEDMEP